MPSALLAPVLPGTSVSGINDSANSHDGMLIFQRRMDRRPIIIAAPKLISGDLSGTIYAKSGHVTLLSGQGVYDLNSCAGRYAS